MDAPNLNQVGHSADVRIELHVNGHVLPVAQLGPDFLVLRNSTDFPPADAEISMSIDGKESRWRVYLSHGIRPGTRKTTLAPCR